jgi:hypothetical protein
MAQVQTSTGSWVSESWPYGDLPVPTLSGSSALYADVLPDVDLQLTATPAGMAEVLVVKSAQAAADPRLQTVKLTVAGQSSLSEDAQDSTVAKVADGSAVVSASPQWWDSRNAGSSTRGPGGVGGLQPVDDSLSGSAITMDLSALSDPDVVFPAYVDPDWTPTGSPYWFTDAAYPNQSYLNGQYSTGTQSVGGASDSSHTYHSDAFWQFSLTGVPSGAKVMTANLSTTQEYSATCSPSAIEVRAYGPETAGFTWSQEQSYGSGKWGAVLATTNYNYGCSGVAAHSVGWTVTSAVASAVTSKASSIQLGISAVDPNSLTSRRHYAFQASVTIDYDRPPTTPSKLTVVTPPRGCGTSPSQVSFSTEVPTLTLSAYMTDPDGDAVNARFYIMNTNDLTKVVLTKDSSATTTNTVSVSWTQSSTTTAILPEGTYAWRAQGGDGTLTTAFTGYCYFTVDNTSPTAPVFAAGSGPIKNQTVGVGFDVDVAFSSTQGVARLAYEWQDSVNAGDPQIDVVGASAGSGVLAGALPACDAPTGIVYFACPDPGAGTWKLNVVPIDNEATLWVWTYDASGNQSAPTGIEVDSGAAPTVSYAAGHGWIDASSSAGVVADRNTTAESQSLTIDRGSGATSTAAIGNVNANVFANHDVAAFDFSGYVTLERTTNAVSAPHGASTGYATVTEAAAPSGYTADPHAGPAGYLAQLMPLDTTTFNSATMRELYLCTLTAGGYFSSLHSDCEGAGTVVRGEGYLWDSQPDGVQSAYMYRCNYNGHYFDVVNDTTCDGTGAYASGYGWVLDTGAVETAAPAAGAPAVDNTESYSVSAWVNPSQSAITSKRAFAIISETGGTSYDFILDMSAGKFNFCRRVQATPSNYQCAYDPASATRSAGDWYFVTGIYDAANSQLRLIVSDGDSSTIPQTSTAATAASDTAQATGPVMVGSAVLSGLQICQWAGQIAHPAVFPGVIDGPQLQNLAQDGDPAGDPGGGFGDEGTAQ